VVPEVVAGEAFTKLRYDRRISGRRDARPALAVFNLLATNPEVFEMRAMPGSSRFRAVEVVAKYVDQNFSWVDAIVLLSADDDRHVQALWTVDSSLSAYRFSHHVTLSTP
jgi:predicted nucleic acid-binding protein